jgi:hypothetical protein
MPRNGLRKRLRGTRCVYCGEHASAEDHYPPRCVSNIGFVLPACVECNGLASTYHPFNFAARASHVKGRLQHRYGKILHVPKWSEAEITELGRGLSDAVQVIRAQKAIVADRLAWDAVAYAEAISGLGGIISSAAA